MAFRKNKKDLHGRSGAFMSQEDISQLETAYTEDGELYVLKDIDKDTRASLNEILGKPMLMLGGLTVEMKHPGKCWHRWEYRKEQIRWRLLHRCRRMRERR